MGPLYFPSWNCLALYRLTDSTTDLDPDDGEPLVIDGSLGGTIGCKFNDCRLDPFTAPRRDTVRAASETLQDDSRVHGPAPSHARPLTRVLSHAPSHTRPLTRALSHAPAHTRPLTRALSRAPSHARPLTCPLSRAPSHAPPLTCPDLVGATAGSGTGQLPLCRDHPL